jgi:hypothetical protein
VIEQKSIFIATWSYTSPIKICKSFDQDKGRLESAEFKVALISDDDKIELCWL